MVRDRLKQVDRFQIEVDRLSVVSDEKLTKKFNEIYQLVSATRRPGGGGGRGAIIGRGGRGLGGTGPSSRP